LNGGIIADDIRVIDTFIQQKFGNRNIILSKVGDIGVHGTFSTEEAVVYAARDLRSMQVHSDLDINGIMLAGRDVYMWTFVTLMAYRYIEMYPADMGAEYDHLFEVVSWNR